MALEWATEIVKDKFGHYYLNGETICSEMLANYDDVDINIYNDFVNKIYVDKELARMVVGKCSGSNIYSFLTLTLQNPSLVLTEEEKEYVIEETFNKEASAHTAYGNDFNIKYWILKNNNWSKEEKEELVLKLYPEAYEYELALEQWKYSVINDYRNFKGHTLSQLNMEKLLDYTYDDLLNLYGNKDDALEIWSEIEFLNFANPLWLDASEKGMTKTIGTIGVTKNRG